MEYSTHYGFRLPQPHDPVLVDDLNQNFRSLDDIIRKESGTVSTADSQQVFYGVFNPKDNYEVIAETGSSPAAAQAINPDRSRYFTLTNQTNPKVNLFRASDQKKLTSFTFSNLSAGSPFAFLGVDDTHVAIQHNKTVFVVKYTGPCRINPTDLMTKWQTTSHPHLISSAITQNLPGVSFSTSPASWREIYILPAKSCRWKIISSTLLADLILSPATNTASTP
mgnify:CR=1 FL=1